LLRPTNKIEQEQLKGKTGVGTTEKCVFNCCLNISRYSEEIMSEGKSFHMHATSDRKGILNKLIN